MNSYNKFAKQEQKILKISIGLTFLLAAGGIFIGFATGSSSIIFDGTYSAVDSLFSMAALLIARLIYLDANRHLIKTPRFTKRFHHGFWHLEPILLAINAIVLTIAVVYGFVDALRMIFHGGHIPDFGPAVIFALMAVFMCFGAAFYEHKKNKVVQSDFIAIDVKSWAISGGISLALLVAFLLALFIRDTPYQWMVAYIDPMVLAVITAVMMPMPVKTIINASKDILLITPVELDKKIREVVAVTIERYGFIDAQCYLAKVGRSTMIEIHLIAPKNYDIGGIEFLDQIRSEIGDAIGDAGPDRWFTVSFTAEEKWAF